MYPPERGPISRIGSPACTNAGTKFDTRLMPDGTEAPFVIPARRVLVVTEIDILGFGAAPGAGVQTRIFRGVGMEVNIAAIRESIADGLAAAPAAFIGMMRGKNFGKQLVKLT